MAAIGAGHFIARPGKDKPQRKRNRGLVIDRQDSAGCVHDYSKSSNVCTGGEGMSSISRTRLKRYIVNLEPGRAFDFTAGCFFSRSTGKDWNTRREGARL